MNWMTVFIMCTLGTTLQAMVTIEDCKKIANKLPFFDDPLPGVSTNSSLILIILDNAIIYNFNKIC